MWQYLAHCNYLTHLYQPNMSGPHDPPRLVEKHVPGSTFSFGKLTSRAVPGPNRSPQAVTLDKFYDVRDELVTHRSPMFKFAPEPV